MSAAERALLYFRRGLAMIDGETRSGIWTVRRRLQRHITVNAKEVRLTFRAVDNGIGRNLYVFGQHEYDYSVRVVKFLQAEGFLPEERLSMIDIGANIGVVGIGLLSSGLAD